MKIALTLLVTIAVLVAALLVVVETGAYDVAATSPDAGPVARLLETAQERSVRRRAAGIAVPDLAAPGLAGTGLVHYHEMCVTCHGAPGVPASEIGVGLNPFPPELAHEAAEWSDAELFWMVKHGIKMTGMPAFGPTHTDEDLWAIVAFVKRLPETTPEQYAAMVEAAGLGAAGAGHAHGPTEPAAAEPSPGHHHPPGTPPHH